MSSENAQLARALEKLRSGVDRLLPAAVVMAPLAIGTVHPWPRAVLFGLSGFGLALAIAVRHTQGRRIQLTVPMLIITVAAVATTLQLIPLPEPVLRWLSPRTAEVLEQTQRGGYSALPLSLDPPSTIRELSKIVGYLVFLAWATAYCVHAHRRRLVLIAVVVSATTVALLGFLQASLGARILFFYVPHSEILNEILVRGSFVNPNHFGSLMCLGAPCALALVLRERDSRIPAIVALIIINVAVVLSLSRSAIVTAPLVQVVTLLLARAQARGSSSGRFRTDSSLVAIGTVAATLVIALAIGGSRVTTPFSAARTEEFGEPSSNPNSKFFAWRGATDIAIAFPWTGTGRGAFGQGFALLNQRPGALRYEWVENAYLQPIADWGVPVALLLMLLAGWAARTFLRRAMLEPLSIGAAGALIGLAIHDIADFSIEIPGVAIPALALVATLFARQGKEDVGPDLGWFVPARRVWLAVPLLAMALSVAAVWTSDATQDGRQLARFSKDPVAAPAEVIERGSALLRIHPADAHIAALVAERLAKDSHPEAMKWLNDALYLDPTNSRLHLIAAEVLVRAGRMSQALLEYRTAMEYGELPSAVWARISTHYAERDAFVKAAGDSPERMYDLANWLFSHRRVADADLVCEAMLTRDRFSVPASRLHVRTAVAMGDADKVRSRVTALLSMDRATESRYTAVRGLISVGDLDAAGNLLDSTPDRSQTASELSLELAQAMARAQRLDSARARLDKMPALTSRMARARWHEVRATVEHLAGNQHQSAWEHEQALRLQGPAH